MSFELQTTERTCIKSSNGKGSRKIFRRGAFPPGSMGPKIQAAINFELSGEVAIIAAIDKVKEALEGIAGTKDYKRLKQ